MSAEERAVCARLLTFRKSTGVSRAQFARIVGMDARLLASYEMGRSRLNYPAAFQVLSRFPMLNPEWLAGARPDLMEAESYVTYPSPDELESGPRSLFSDVYDEVLRPKLLASRGAFLPDDTPSFPLFRLTQDVAGRLRAEKLIQVWLRRWLAYLPDANLNDYLDQLKRNAESLLDDHLKTAARKSEEFFKEAMQRISEVQKLQLEMEAGMLKAGTRKKELTHPSQSVKSIGDVKIAPQWPELKRRLQEATGGIGAKPALAKVLNVDPTQISQWLSESKSAREPRADVALRMLKWVELQERK